MVPFIENNGKAYFEVSGNTDSTGSREVNLRLSAARARAVVDYLVKQWEFPRERFKIVGNGPDRPLCNEVNAAIEGPVARRLPGDEPDDTGSRFRRPLDLRRPCASSGTPTRRRTRSSGACSASARCSPCCCCGALSRLPGWSARPSCRHRGMCVGVRLPGLARRAEHVADGHAVVGRPAARRRPAGHLIGIPIGIVMGAAPQVNAALSPLVDPFRSAPVVALLPILVMWMGIGESMKIAFLFIGAVVYLIPMVRDAIQAVPQSYWIGARDLGATPWECIRSAVYRWPCRASPTR
jgi:hypothetical protein